MNVKLQQLAVCLTTLPLLIQIPAAFAWDLPVPDTLDDPLLARPPVLDKGVNLPGDKMPVACPADFNPDQILTLPIAVDLALCNNPQVKIAWAAIKIQAGSVGEARAAYLPTITGSLSFLRSETKYKDATGPNISADGRTAYANINWKLFDFGGREANSEAANLTLTAALSSYDATLQKTLSVTIGSYFDAMVAQANFQSKTQIQELASKTAIAAKNKEVRGASLLNDTLQAQAAFSKAKLAATRAQGDNEKALSLLIYHLGLPMETKIQLPTELPVPSPNVPGDLEKWLIEAKHNHPALVAARAQYTAAQAKIQSARAAGLPTVDFVGNYYQNGYPNQGLFADNAQTGTAGVTLSIPFFEGFSRTYKIREAQAQAEQSNAQASETEHQVLNEIVKVYADAKSALHNLQSSDELLATMGSVLSSAQRRFEKNAGDVVEVLNAQASLADAQQEHIRCVAEWQSARLKLLANSGQLGKEQLSKLIKNDS